MEPAWGSFVLRAQRIVVLLVFATAAPIAAVALWSISHTVIEISDPCASWDYPPGQGLHIGPHDPCREASVQSESKARAVTRAAMVPGGLLAAAILALMGAVLSRRRVLIAAGIGMLAETVVVFTIAPLTLVAGVSYLLLARRIQPGS
jgi:hypothetical protein